MQQPPHTRKHRCHKCHGRRYFLPFPILILPLFCIVLLSSYTSTSYHGNGDGVLNQILSLSSSSSAFFCHASLIKPQRNKKIGSRKRQSVSGISSMSPSSNNKVRMSMENVTCYNYTQPLDHFNPGSNNHTFEQRYCVYDYDYDYDYDDTLLGY